MIDQKEESLRDVLVRIYRAVKSPAAAASAGEIPACRSTCCIRTRKSTVLEFLNLEGAKLAKAEWAAVEIRLCTETPLFLKPLLASGPGKYAAGLRAAIVAYIEGAADEKGFRIGPTDAKRFFPAITSPNCMVARLIMVSRSGRCRTPS